MGVASCFLLTFKINQYLLVFVPGTNFVLNWSAGFRLGESEGGGRSAIEGRVGARSAAGLGGLPCSIVFGPLTSSIRSASLC